jgi:nicotinate phosphoribosyltransferase
MPIINSILDTDLYKISMMHAIVETFPDAEVEYTFTNRNNTPFPDGFDYELRKEIDSMRNLALTQDEKKFLQEKCGHYLNRPFLDLLSGYRYDPSEVGVVLKDGELSIKIRGFWYRTVLWEVPLMALISELFFKMTGQEPTNRAAREKNNIQKGLAFQTNNLILSEFGTRRRYSYEIQDEVVSDLKSCYGSNKFLKGTSNVHLAMKHGLNPHGTHAHEWFMFMGAQYGFKMSNTMGLKHWSDVFHGELGIALSDTLTTDVFFKSFDTKYAKLFDGVRHDSSDPFEFTDKTVSHYKKLGIDPNLKQIVFSDSLNTNLCIEIHNYCKGKIKDSFGVGTHLTNDVGVKPLNMVIKLTSAKILGEWVPTVKLSDNPGKHTGDKKTIELCKEILNIKEVETSKIN